MSGQPAHRGGMPALPEDQRRGVRPVSVALSEEEKTLLAQLLARRGEQSRSGWIRELILAELEEEFGYVDVTRRAGAKRGGHRASPKKDRTEGETP